MLPYLHVRTVACTHVPKARGNAVGDSDVQVSDNSRCSRDLRTGWSCGCGCCSSSP
jgi:hypothetical protein